MMKRIILTAAAVTVMAVGLAAPAMAQGTHVKSRLRRASYPGSRKRKEAAPK